MRVSLQDVIAFRQSGSWRRLEQVALMMVKDAQEKAGSNLAPKLGGGTRLMLALNHRISHDIGQTTPCIPVWREIFARRLYVHCAVGLGLFSWEVAKCIANMARKTRKYGEYVAKSA